MTTASLPELRRGINNVPSALLPELCLRMARFRKENKELLSYLLFDADDEIEYIRTVKVEIEESFSKIVATTPYQTKKGLRKILALINLRIRISGQKRTEAEILIHFCRLFKEEIPFRSFPTIRNIYLRQLEKAKMTIASLHEDLQFDFNEEIRSFE